MSLLSIIKESIKATLASGVVNNTLPLYAIISAEKAIYDDNGVPINNHPTNLKRTKLLKNILMSDGYNFTSVEGKYKFKFPDNNNKFKEVIENSFIIYPKEDQTSESFTDKMLELAKEFDQESVLIRDKSHELPFRLIFTNGSPDIGIGTKMKLVTNIDEEDYYTKIGNKYYAVK